MSQRQTVWIDHYSTPATTNARQIIFFWPHSGMRNMSQNVSVLFLLNFWILLIVWCIFFVTVENPYSLLPCSCHEATPGKTAVKLGPLWCVYFIPLFYLVFVELPFKLYLHVTSACASTYDVWRKQWYPWYQVEVFTPNICVSENGCGTHSLRVCLHHH